MRSKISSTLIFASCVWYSDRAYCELCVVIRDIGRRLPLQLQCSYQGEQGVFNQSVRANYKPRFWGRQNLTAVEGNVSFYQVNPVSGITGEGGGGALQDVEAWFWSKASGVGGGRGTGGQFVRVSCKSFQGHKSDCFGKCILYILSNIFYVNIFRQASHTRPLQSCRHHHAGYCCVECSIIRLRLYCPTTLSLHVNTPWANKRH